MPSASIFSRLPDPAARRLSFRFEGETLEAREGDSLAAALLAAGRSSFRDTPVSGTPRAPFCMMGLCFDCLVEVDGRPNRQACLVQVAEGMEVRRMTGAREAFLRDRPA